MTTSRVVLAKINGKLPVDKGAPSGILTKSLTTVRSLVDRLRKTALAGCEEPGSIESNTTLPLVKLAQLVRNTVQVLQR